MMIGDVTHDALLASVIERPDEDGPRLVLADYYEDYGFGDRARLIRIQCELKYKVCFCTVDKVQAIGVIRNHRYQKVEPCRACLLTEEQSALTTNDNLNAWIPDTPAFAAVTRAKFVRGMVEFIELPGEDWVKHGDDLLTQAPIQTVALTTLPLMGSATPDSRGLRTHWGFTNDPKQPLPVFDEFSDLFRQRWPYVKEWTMPPLPVGHHSRQAERQARIGDYVRQLVGETDARRDEFTRHLRRIAGMPLRRIEGNEELTVAPVIRTNTAMTPNAANITTTTATDC